ncbi:MAG: biotin transporter BioY [Coxiellaceae bacterium]|nr:biotin transporter BioY [Coxiellaceae bacterium]
MRIQTVYRPIIAINQTAAKNAVIVVLASVVLALISQIALHLWWPVPITLQSAMVVLLGLSLGSKRASAAVALYLLEGALGLPVFAGGLSGFAYLLGSSAGYLWGFLPAAFVAGFLMEKGFAKNYISIFAAGLIATTVIFFCGFSHLTVLIGFHNAYVFGVKPFLLVEPIKLMVATLVAKSAWQKAS